MKKTRKMFIMILTLFSGFCFLLCGLEGCQTLPDRGPIEKDGNTYYVLNIAGNDDVMEDARQLSKAAPDLTDDFALAEALQTIALLVQRLG